MSEREKLKKRAESVAAEDWLKVEASTILALLSELEQAEAEIADANQRFTFYGVSAEEDLTTGIDNVFCKGKEASEAALRTLRQASAWIPVAEKLPETAHGVLVSRGDIVEEACWEGEERGWELIRTDAYDQPINLHGEITHWKPLPKSAAALAAEGKE
jgi:hypothetical protein